MIAPRLALAVAVALLAGPLYLSVYQRALALAILADVALAVAWAFFSGPTRYLSLATGAFFGAGAYTTAILGPSLPWPLPVLAGAVAGGALAAVVGALALRLRGPYFAVFTFGLAELAKHTVIWYETGVTGTVGRLLLAPPEPWTIYYTILGLAGLAVTTAWGLRRSRWGYALAGIGADEERAETLGINTTLVKIGVFALSAAFMGAVGAAMAPRWTYLDPNVFNPFVSFQVVIMALLGGVGSLWGPVAGAVFIGLASEILLLNFRYLYMLGLGLTLIIVVLVLPSGLTGLARHPRRRGVRPAPEPLARPVPTAPAATDYAAGTGLATEPAGPPRGGRGMYTVNIDVGGTLTDGLFSDGTRLVLSKVDTTPHDLTVCFFDCLADGAARLGFPDLGSFLRQVELIRWSTTITSNVLAERRGPKLGLIVTRGQEERLYGDRPSPALERLVERSNIVGVDRAPDRAEILATVRRLLEQGVRRICVSLEGARANPEPERQIKAIIEEQYPDHFLGSVPVLTGTEIARHPDDMTRTHAALINAYTHASLAATLFKADDELRETHGFTRAFLVSHINGGAAGVSKTRAIDTIESGPIMGLYASRALANLYGLRQAVSLDVGGTTAKVGVILDGNLVRWRAPVIFGIPVKLPLPYLRSISLGGGSVARAGAGPGGTTVTLGPESMGAYPGPACYGLGGNEATLTDAFVAAGIIDPEHFLGGKRTLLRDRAREVIAERIAAPLGLTVEEAAQRVMERAFETVAGAIREMTRELGKDPEAFALLAFGGNGGLFAGEVAERLGIRHGGVFSLGPVLSAFGAALADLEHVYEQAVRIPLWAGTELGPLNAALEAMRAEGVRDMRGEGFREEEMTVEAEVEVRLAEGEPVTVSLGAPRVPSAEHLLAEVERAAASRRASPEMVIELLRVRARKAIPKPALPEEPPGREEAAGAPAGRRTLGTGCQAPLYRWEALAPGNAVTGPAVLDSELTTYYVPEGWSLTLDRYRNGVLRAAAERPLRREPAAPEPLRTFEPVARPMAAAAPGPAQPVDARPRRIRITEYLDLDLDQERWHCNRCGQALGPASENYKKGCLVHHRDPREIHPPLVDAPYSFSPDPSWVRIVEFYCPGCGTQIETEYLPPGHPITHDIEIDVRALKARIERGELVIREGRLGGAE